MQGAQVQSLIRELRSHMLRGAALKKKTNHEVDVDYLDITDELTEAQKS